MTRTPITFQFAEWITRVEGGLETLRLEASQDVIAEMQRVGPSVANPDGGDGGHMPVDTGWLRSSLSVTLDQPTPASQTPPPRPEGHAPGDDPIYEPRDNDIVMTLANVPEGTSIFATYGAVYAGVQEATYGFARLASQQWPQFCEAAQARIRRRLGL